MTEYEEQIQTLKSEITEIDSGIARVNARLEVFYPERAQLEADLEELATVRSKIVALAAHSDEAYAKLRPHDRSVEELEQRKADLGAMIERLEAERSGLDAARQSKNDLLRRYDELHMREVAKRRVAALAERFRVELTDCALAHRMGSSWESWHDARYALASILFPTDPRTLPPEERDAIRHRVTDGLLGTPLAQ